MHTLIYIREFLNLSVHRDGTSAWFATGGASMLVKEGGLCGFRGADIINVTERMRDKPA